MFVISLHFFFCFLSDCFVWFWNHADTVRYGASSVSTKLLYLCLFFLSFFLFVELIVGKIDNSNVAIMDYWSTGVSNPMTIIPTTTTAKIKTTNKLKYKKKLKEARSRENSMRCLALNLAVNAIFEPNS